MHRALTARWINRALRISEGSPLNGVPLYLCPAIGSFAARSGLAGASISRRHRANHTDAAVSSNAAASSSTSATTTTTTTQTPEAPRTPARRLPLTCSGCGAFSQTEDPHQLGYFDLSSKRVRIWLHPRKPESRRPEEAEEDEVVDKILKSLDPSKLEGLGLSPAAMLHGEESVDTAHQLAKPPVCDRCHNLIHHSTTSDTARVAMYHPTVESLRETIEESPHKYNHIYHVIDAADFPMSLIPRLNVLLGDIALRTRNRRSRASKFQKDRKTELSFIITRSDLLGPTKEMVDAMMPYLREVLRDALGRFGERVRLGNVRCVSARRAWWTTTLKEDIWHRGGAGWMVGKVNVGKSQLFEAVYPKGRMSEKHAGRAGVSTRPRLRERPTAELMMPDKRVLEEEEEGNLDELDFGELLPPPQPAQNYPKMPVVSSLPGTTASPIRVPFGNGKGELIDLPGLARSDLELFVKEEDRQSLIMQKRIVPEQVTVKPGKSLILGGGLICITPRTPGMIFLMYNFTPLTEHLTVTDKAIAFQNQTRQSVGVASIMLPGVGDKMKHAGTFKLCHDVTKARAGPLTRKNAVGLQVEKLPFRVLSLDILIEGVGYVEIVAQVRKRDFELVSKAQSTPAAEEAERREEEEEEEEEGDNDGKPKTGDLFAQMMSLRRDFEAKTEQKREPKPEPEPDWPAVDVYTPEGRFVGSRKPINGWLNNKPRVLPEHKRGRPRRSMRGQKRMEKLERRRDAGDLGRIPL